MGVHQQDDKQSHHQQELQTAVQATKFERQEAQHDGDGVGVGGSLGIGKRRGIEMIVRELTSMPLRHGIPG